MNLNTITEIRRGPVTGTGGALLDWQDGDAWLAGGTWLFSEPQPHLRRLTDVTSFNWAPLAVSERGLLPRQRAFCHPERSEGSVLLGVRATDASLRSCENQWVRPRR